MTSYLFGSSQESKNEHQYVNISQQNQTVSPVPCSVTNTYSTAVIDNASEYRLEIWRFLLPLSQLPIFIAQPLDYTMAYYSGNVQIGSSTTSIILDSNANNVDNKFYQTSDIVIGGETRDITSYVASTRTITLAIPLSSSPVGKLAQIFNKDYTRLKYSITLEFNDAPCQRYLQYIPNASVSNGVIQQPSNFSPTHPKPTQQEIPYYFVYSYEVFLHEVNQAINYAYNLFLNGVMGAPTSPPYFEYNASTQLISLYAVATYALGAGVNVALDVNSSLQTFFTSFDTYILGYGQPDGRDFQFAVGGTGTNGIKSADFTFPSYYMDPSNDPFPAGDGFKMSGEYNSQYYWNAFRSIVFQTTLLPVNTEVIPNVMNSSTQYRSILTDFEISANMAGDSRSFAQFFPQGPLRVIDLLNNKPISKIDIQVYWTDISGNFYPLYLPVGNSWDMKIGFRRK